MICSFLPIAHCKEHGIGFEIINHFFQVIPCFIARYPLLFGFIPCFIARYPLLFDFIPCFIVRFRHYVSPMPTSPNMFMMMELPNNVALFRIFYIIHTQPQPSAHSVLKYYFKTDFINNPLYLSLLRSHKRYNALRSQRGQRNG